MCINIDKVGTIPDPSIEIEAYKVVKIDHNTYEPHFQFCLLNGSSEIPVNQWITCGGRESQLNAVGKPNASLLPNDYPNGFHVYKFPIPISTERVIKVRIRKIVAQGTSVGDSCYIAQEMYVEWPQANDYYSLQ